MPFLTTIRSPKYSKTQIAYITIMIAKYYQYDKIGNIENSNIGIGKSSGKTLVKMGNMVSSRQSCLYFYESSIFIFIYANRRLNILNIIGCSTFLFMSYL